MKTDRNEDLRNLLRRHDPAGIDPPLEGDDLARMRRAVVMAAVKEGSSSRAWSVGWAAAGALVVLVLAAGGSLWLRGGPESPGGRRERPANPPQVEHASRAGGAEAREARQLQMVTPGGTRVVWILNPDLNL